MSWEITYGAFSAVLLAFCRMGGALFFNPVLSRRSVPAGVRAGLALGLAIIVAPLKGSGMPQEPAAFRLIMLSAQELMIGVACGIVLQFFFYLLFFAGDVIDTGFGLSMAKVFDPGSSIQMSLSGNLLQLLFILYFFATDSHLLLIRVMTASYDVVPMGAARLTGAAGSVLAGLFVTAFDLIMRLTLPFLAASFVLELSMGILMKLIPQINVFVIHFQTKILLGMVLLFLFAVPVTEFMNGYIETMFASMSDLLKAFA